MEYQTLFNALDAQRTITLIDQEIGSFPGYMFFADEDLVEVFDKLWGQGFRLTCLQMLSDLDDIDLHNYNDVKKLIDEN